MNIPGISKTIITGIVTDRENKKSIALHTHSRSKKPAAETPSATPRRPARLDNQGSLVAVVLSPKWRRLYDHSEKRLIDGDDVAVHTKEQRGDESEPKLFAWGSQAPIKGSEHGAVKASNQRL